MAQVMEPDPAQPGCIAESLELMIQTSRLERRDHG